MLIGLKQSVLGLLLLVGGPEKIAPQHAAGIFCETQPQIESIFDLWQHQGKQLPEAVSLVNASAKTSACVFEKIYMIDSELVNRVDSQGKVYGVYKLFAMAPLTPGTTVSTTVYAVIELPREAAM